MIPANLASNCRIRVSVFPPDEPELPNAAPIRLLVGVRLDGVDDVAEKAEFVEFNELIESDLWRVDSAAFWAASAASRVLSLSFLNITTKLRLLKKLK